MFLGRFPQGCGQTLLPQADWDGQRFREDSVWGWYQITPQPLAQSLWQWVANDTSTSHDQRLCQSIGHVSQYVRSYKFIGHCALRKTHSYLVLSVALEPQVLVVVIIDALILVSDRGLVLDCHDSWSGSLWVWGACFALCPDVFRGLRTNLSQETHEQSVLVG